MARIHGWLYALRSLIRRNSADREMADEIAFHVDRQTRKHESRGVATDEARRLALLEFGGTTRWREDARQARSGALIDLIDQDVRQTIRGLRRDPAFAIMAVVALAVALGANATMFGIIDRVMLRGPEYVASPDELQRVYLTRTTANGGPVTSGWQSYAFYRTLRDDAAEKNRVAMYTLQRLRLGSGTEARFVPVTYATADLYPLIGVHAALGRFYSADEDRPPAGESVIVLGYQLWQSAFAGDSAIVGKLVTLSDHRYQVVGVAPRGFTGVGRARMDAWLPFSLRALDGGAPPNWATDWRMSIASIVVRVTAAPTTAAARLTTTFRRAYVGPNAAMAKGTVTLLPVSYDMNGAEPAELGVARLLAGVALVMLLVAAANATNLSLARAMRRQRELSVRAALGASRWRIARLMVTESLMIALVGGALGLALARWGGAVVRDALLPGVAWTELPLDGRVLAWTAAASCLTGVLVGLIPAIRVARGDVAASLRSGRTGALAAGDSHGRARAALQIAQLALSLVLVFAAALFVKSLRNIRHLDLGYDRERVLAVDVAMPQPDVADDDVAARAATAAHARYDDLRERFARLPGVASVSVAAGSPLSSVEVLRVHVPGVDSVASEQGGAVVTNVGPRYFETVGTRLLRGRTFAPSDAFAAAPVAIINRTMAEKIWPGRDAIGQCVMWGRPTAPCARIVGIVQDVHHMSLREPAISQLYLTWGEDALSMGDPVLLVRASSDPRTLVPALTDVLRRAAPDLQSVEMQTFDELLDPQVRPWRVGAILFGLFGGVVVLVAAIGLFSVVSYLVTQRTHEIGVRIALGAQSGQVLRLVMGRGIGTAIVGALVGAVISIAIGPIINPLLFENHARDPMLLAIAAVGLLLVAALASVWPSWRATRVDPLIAIRED